MHGNIFASKREGNEDALRTLREVNHTSGRAPNVSLIGMSLSGAFSQGATDSQTRMAKIKFPTPISSGSLSHLPARQRWMDWHMRIIQQNVLESIGTSVAPGIRLWKHSNNVWSASNMIPCFPASNGTDAHHCDTISKRSSPSHFTKDRPSNISQVRTRSTTTYLCHCLENQKGYYYLRNSDKGECSCRSSSQDD